MGGLIITHATKEFFPGGFKNCTGSIKSFYYRIKTAFEYTCNKWRMPPTILFTGENLPQWKFEGYLPLKLELGY